MAKTKKKIKDKQRAKYKEKKATQLVAAFFNAAKENTITYVCMSCGAEVEVPKLSIEMNITTDEDGEIDIPGYECEACGDIMMLKNPEEVNLREAKLNDVFREFKNKNFKPF